MAWGILSSSSKERDCMHVVYIHIDLVNKS